MKRLLTFVAAGAVAAALAAPAAATPPNPPPGCDVAPNTPAGFTGSDQGFNNKVATFDRLCAPV